MAARPVNPSRQGMAVAIFAKTPGLTPAKTRLAAGAGRATADAFYQRALDITQAVVCAAAATESNLVPYWAVAERDAIGRECWAGLPQLWQGEGALGERLAQVYGKLQSRHDAVLVIGADSPLLSVRHLLQAHELLGLAGRDFVIGRALDGGFYLFGGKPPVGREIWTSVSYSAADTAEQLVRKLGPLGLIGELPPLLDVDTAEDLRALPSQPTNAAELLPVQQALLSWIGTLPVA